MKPVTIAVYPHEQLSGHQRLFDALGSLFSVRFEPRNQDDWNDCAGVVLLDVDLSVAARTASSGPRRIAFLDRSKSLKVLDSAGPVALGASALLAQCFRAQVLPDTTIHEICALSLESSDEILASKCGLPFWVRRPVGSSFLDLIATECPALGAEEFLFSRFYRDDWAKLLPLIHFVRDLSPWTAPPLRATFMFDDPNLHWRTYGYIRFKELAEHATVHNYHVCFATVPLDAWFIHHPTAAFFKQNQARLSLVTHGNNHLARELAQVYSDEQRSALGTQALRRLRRFERVGLEVPGIMVAPHGALSEENAQFLLKSGFEAACVSRPSLMLYNETKSWGTTIGLNLAEFVGDGFPVISRFGLSRSRAMDFRIAAFLGKPIILDGHHEDLAQGLGIMEELARLVNSFGEVQWVGMKAIARSNFATARAGTDLVLKLYARRINFVVPKNVERIKILRPWLGDGQSEAMDYQVGSLPPRQLEGSENFIPVETGLPVEIDCVPKVPVTNGTSASIPLWAIARRWLCEARDRLRPISDRLRVSQG